MRQTVSCRITLVLLCTLYSYLGSSSSAEAFLFQRLRPVATSKLASTSQALYQDTTSHSNLTSSAASSSYQIVNAHQDVASAAVDSGGFSNGATSRGQPAPMADESLEEEQQGIDGCPSVCSCNRAAQIADCSHRNLNRVPSGFPSDIRRIRLERNNITEIGAHAFAGLKRLQRIDLSNNNLVKIDPLAFAGGLQSLSSLILYSNKLAQLPVNVFSELSQLQLLLLNANSIQCISRELFQSLGNLNLLSLYDNNIETITNGTFDGLKSIKTIHLGKNPLICDCNLGWLANYLEASPVETSEARCEWPRRNQAAKLGQLNKQRFRCEGSEEARSSQLAAQCQAHHRLPAASLGAPGAAAASAATAAAAASPGAAGDQCPAGCLCDGSTVDCSRVSLSKSRQAPAAYEIPDVPDDIPVYVTRMRINDSRIKRFRQTNLFRRLASSHKLLSLSQPAAAQAAAGQQPAPFLGAFEQYCARDLGNNRIIDIEDNAIGAGAPGGPSKADRIIFVLVENEHCSAPRTGSGANQAAPTQVPSEEACASAPRVNAPDFNSPCYNGGSCVGSSELTRRSATGAHHQQPTLNYSCICPPGFTGPLCEINIDDCIEHQCQNGAMCVDQVNGYRCVCRDPTTSGEFCEQFSSPSAAGSNLIGSAPLALPIVGLNPAPAPAATSDNSLPLAPAVQTNSGAPQQVQARSTDLMRPPVELGALDAAACKRVTQRNHYYDGKGCRSARMLKISECMGTCSATTGDESCCQPAKVKRRKVRMQCSDGASYVKTIDLIKKCACSSGEQCTAQLTAANFYNATLNLDDQLSPSPTTRLGGGGGGGGEPAD